MSFGRMTKTLMKKVALPNGSEGRFSPLLQNQVTFGIKQLNIQKIATTSTALIALGIVGLGVKPAAAAEFKFSQGGISWGSVNLSSPELEDALSLSRNPQAIQSLNSRNSSIDISSLGNIPNLIGTPGNDIIIGERDFNNNDGYRADFMVGRTGSDRLIGANPANPFTTGEFDIFIGGPDVTTDGNNPNTPSKDLLVLGDYLNPYYAANQGILGTEDLAFIIGFNPTEDTIRLNGNRRDYFLSEFSVSNTGQTGTALFRRNSGPDLVALLPETSNLSLNSDYFEFVNSPPPNEIQPDIKQKGSTGPDLAFDVAKDSAGNIYTTGLTTGDLGGTSAGGKDAFIIKYDSNGNQQFIKQLGTEGSETAFGIATDQDDNFYITGSTTGSLGGANLGVDDAYLAKYDSNGNRLWIKQFGTAQLDTSFGIVTDKDGNVYTTGYTSGNLGAINQGSDLLIPTTDPYVTKFDTNGNLLWTTQFGTAEYDDSYGISIDKDGNVFITGWTFGNLAATNAGLYDATLTKIRNDGSIEWIKQFGTEGYEFAWDSATDTFGNVYSVGFTTGSLGGNNAGLYDIFLAKYDTNGNQQWIELLGTAGSENAFAIDIDENNNIFLTGYTTGSFEGTNAGGDRSGAEDAFWAMFDTNGNLLNIDQFGTSGVDRGFGIDARGGKLAITGFTDGSLGAPNKGSFDAFVTIKKGQPQSVPEPSGTLALIASAGLLLTKTIKKRSTHNVPTK